ncbi:threonine-phosphate decarboxylase CobD [Dechloromonas sp. ZY10]|uniref:threonine-phosphate decarboxylase CobD n=1 Tax=Dechloromonas aquae TaxID=2664436 RepID=UPI00352902A5
MLEHGGRLRAAATRHGILLADWLDLSTGINPQGWPVPALPASVWNRLPEDDDGLEAAAAAYYGNDQLLPLAGSQAAIQMLPALFPHAAIACLGPLYAEHPHAWQQAGHKLRQLNHATLTRALSAVTPYVLCCHPNNPTAVTQSREGLLEAAAQLQKRGGWLFVDEAFVDCTPELSVTPEAASAAAPNLIVFRSLGKFFGLAGARVGFLFAPEEIRHKLREALGPWAISGPAREVARLALADHAWQSATRPRLRAAGERLAELLGRCGEVRHTPLFATLSSERAGELADFLAARGILVRNFPEQALLRCGLPADEAGWQRLTAALTAWQTS